MKESEKGDENENEMDTTAQCPTILAKRRLLSLPVKSKDGGKTSFGCPTASLFHSSDEVETA